MKSRKSGKNKRRAALSAGVLMSISGVAGKTDADVIVNREVGPQQGSSFDLMFENVTSAKDLVSISNGTVVTGEGVSLTISAIKTDDQVINLYSGSSGCCATIPLSDLTSNNYTAFPESDIKGLRFSASGQGSMAIIPAGTVLAFLAVPEPGTALLLGLGFAALSSRPVRRLFRR